MFLDVMQSKWLGTSGAHNSAIVQCNGLHAKFSNKCECRHQPSAMQGTVHSHFLMHFFFCSVSVYLGSVVKW